MIFEVLSTRVDANHPPCDGSFRKDGVWCIQIFDTADLRKFLNLNEPVLFFYNDSGQLCARIFYTD